jgi:hypothetical protein
VPIAIPEQQALRQVEVIIGPPGGVGRRFRGQASPTQPGLWIAGIVEHTSGSRPNKGKIKIHNLGDDSAGFIDTPGNVIQVLAGEDGTGGLFRGDITRVETRQETPTRVTAIEAAEGQRIWRDSVIAQTWPPNTTRTQILSDVLAVMGAARGRISALLPERVFATGLVWSGATRDLLNMLYDADLGERWTMTGNAVDVIADGDAPGNVQILAPDTGLIGSPARTKRGGVKAKVKLSATLRPGGGIEVSSRFVQGLFRIVKVVHQFDSRGSPWLSDVEGVKP